MKRTTRRRGVSVLLVLGLLTMTLALSYAMVRTNYTVQRTHANYERLGDSRQAAYAGLSVGLRKMQQADWAGVDTRLTGELGGGLSYSIAFATGDPALDPTSPDYAELPYRVTVTATGIATDPANSAVRSTHKVAAVVRLIPRKLAEAPANWSETQQYTLYQWGTQNRLQLNLPVRIEGPIYAQSPVEVGQNIPKDIQSRPFNGLIDEVALFGGALSDTEIHGLCWGWIALDDPLLAVRNPVATWRLNESAGALLANDQWERYDGIYDGGRPSLAPAPSRGGSSSATFDGWNDQVHLGTIGVDGTAMTIAMWIKPNALASDYQRFIAKASGVNESDQYWTLAAHPYDGRQTVRFQLKTEFGGTATLIASNTNLTAGNWTHIAAVYDGSLMKVYQDGELKNVLAKFGNIIKNDEVLVSLGNTPAAHPCAKYLRDLTRGKELLGNDLRPVTGPITAPLSQTTDGERSLFTDELKVAWQDTPLNGTAPVSHPGKVISYQLYPGGKQYSVPALEGTLQNQQLGPDPENNPLGVYFRLGNLDVLENVTVTGTVVVYETDSTPDIEILGTNVRFQPVTLPAVFGSPTGVQLPVAIVMDDLRVYDKAAGEFAGLAMAWGEVGFRGGSDQTAFAVQGRIMAQEFYVEPRSEWVQTDLYWTSELTRFYRNLEDPEPILFFPQWLKNSGQLDPNARLSVTPPAESTVYHWHDWTQPVFVPHPDDQGLRWEVLELYDPPPL